MSQAKPRDLAESVFSRNQRREAEIEGALKQEAARQADVIKNMHRLKTLRLARNAECVTAASSPAHTPVRKRRKA
jgi:hypothetical protein